VESNIQEKRAEPPARERRPGLRRKGKTPDWFGKGANPYPRKKEKNGKRIREGKKLTRHQVSRRDWEEGSMGEAKAIWREEEERLMTRPARAGVCKGTGEKKSSVYYPGGERGGEKKEAIFPREEKTKRNLSVGKERDKTRRGEYLNHLREGTRSLNARGGRGISLLRGIN